MTSMGVGLPVFSSSATVSVVASNLPYTEAHLKNPTSPYGHTKRQFEQMQQDLSQSATGSHFGVLRYFNPVGTYSSGNLE